ncbi:DUF1636 family protein [Jannaschia rubra]|uniref:DUF1636 family protein n=1 Tax=Jannaschia rubra TaxID=282197 RepID=UPI0024933BA1|nr:DUF1636 family protein [Jannaschia rubra]
MVAGIFDCMAGLVSKKGERMIVCGGCLPERTEKMVAALRSAVPDCPVEVAACLNACGHPVSLAFRAPGRAVYLFAGTDPVDQAAEVAAFVGLWRSAPRGVVTDARPCGRLRTMLRGCIPA